jgi:hypothetical protein
MPLALLRGVGAQVRATVASFRGGAAVAPDWSAPVERERDLQELEAVWRASGSIDASTDRAWRDLSLDAVFVRVDRCISSAGQQMLYRRLRTPSTTEDDAHDLQRRVRAFAEDEATRTGLARALQPLGRASTLRLSAALHAAPEKAPLAARLAPVVTAATILSIAASFVSPSMVLAAVACALLSIALRYALHDRLSVEAVALGSIVNLIGSARDVAALGLPQALGPELRALREVLAPVERYGRALGWFTLDTVPLNDLAASAVAYLNVFFLLDVHAFVRALDLLERHRSSIRLLLETVGELDAARSIASFRADKPTCAPVFGPRGTPIVIRGMRHPLIDDAVPNDVRLERSRGWLIMGSNLSGKSTFLRCVALGAWMAQSIGCVLADAYEAPLLDIRTLMQVEDDLLAGRSHFLAEAEAARDLLGGGPAALDRLCVTDELFRGTNTADRVAAGAAFLRALGRDGAYVLAATHDHELVALLGDDFRPHHFLDVVEDGALCFDHRIRDGAMTARNAFRVLALVGFPTSVIDDAVRFSRSHGGLVAPRR